MNTLHHKIHEGINSDSFNNINELLSSLKEESVMSKNDYEYGEIKHIELLLQKEQSDIIKNFNLWNNIGYQGLVECQKELYKELVGEILKEI